MIGSGIMISRAIGVERKEDGQTVFNSATTVTSCQRYTCAG